ncbi:Bifunctional PGK/TIM [Candidatus Methylomirabilis lanthanidiphila]|uniref:Phosphoglycerate kinase n=1 Tax=Candidatus Methylomirabilis lanthanidiphila TaxID=2211376 RepID=A0A564ZIF7_9BACT|nr:phosphoglycerate kinase [Candidatus Methylomirabilis lanthanidiphila]VUZ84953.1 Bifunctional PGK/TIM [Candidatus Methylomirabilis lanthanidiphila]
MAKLCIDDLQLQGQRLLMRVDFNVPIDEQGAITDDTRIRGALPTISYAVQHGAKVLLISHLGRPKGGPNPKYSLGPAAGRLTALLGRPVEMAEDCVGPQVKARIDRMESGDVLMLENCRFHPEEEKNDEAFSKALAELCDLYVNDAFGTAHRAHASTVGVTRFVKSSACGFLMQKELKQLGALLDHPARPFIAILGGAKVSDKIGVLANLLPKVDGFLIGGGMAYTFLKAQGQEVGGSRVEADGLKVAQETMEQAGRSNVAIHLPSDHVIAERIDANATTRTVDGAIPTGFMGLDIGSATVGRFVREIERAKTILWNGPMGVFELLPFQAGTFALAKAVATSGAHSVIGGGDTAAAVVQAGVADRMTHISTGGGASLEFLEGKELPGIAALTDKN